MRSKRFWGFLLFCALWPVQAAAENRFIVRAPSGVGLLQAVCALQNCTVVLRGPTGALDGTLNQLFLVTTPDTVDPIAFLNILRSLPGIVAAEQDRVISLAGGQNNVPTPLPIGLLLECAGINRREVANARVVQARRSEPTWPRVMRGQSQGCT